MTDLPKELRVALKRAIPVVTQGGMSGAMYPAAVDDGNGFGEEPDGYAIDYRDWPVIADAVNRWADLLDQEPIEIPCPFCKGSGKVPEEHDYATEWLGCPDCQAKGRVRVRLAAEEEVT